MEVGSGEESWVRGQVAVLPGRQVLGHDRGESGLVDESAEEAVERAGVPRDHRRGHDAVGPGDAAGLR